MVHIEMVNILLTARLFKCHWLSRKVLIQCDNEAVVSVLRTGKTCDPYLRACECNIWYLAVKSDMDLCYMHIEGVNNQVADVLSGWQGTPINGSCCMLMFRNHYGLKFHMIRWT